MALFTLSRYVREQWRTLPRPRATSDVSSKTLLITGANVGLGFEAAVHLANLRPKRLLTTSRDQAKCEVARQAIQEQAIVHGTEVHAWPLELASFQSVRAFVDKFVAEGDDVLHAFVANAGVFPSDEYSQTQDGWELTLQVNYLSNALLSILLLPHLIHASTPDSPSRLVWVSSFAHYFLPEQKLEEPVNNILENVHQPAFGDSFARYQVSKVLGIMFIQQLASRLGDTSSIIACAVDPGYCDTGITRYQKNEWVLTIFKWLTLIRSAEAGSRTLVHAAVASDRAMHGRYLTSCQVAEECDFLLSPKGKACAARVWDETVALLSGIDDRVPEIVEKYLRG